MSHHLPLLDHSTKASSSSSVSTAVSPAFALAVVAGVARATHWVVTSGGSFHHPHGGDGSVGSSEGPGSKTDLVGFLWSSLFLPILQNCSSNLFRVSSSHLNFPPHEEGLSRSVPHSQCEGEQDLRVMQVVGCLLGSKRAGDPVPTAPFHALPSPSCADLPGTAVSPSGWPLCRKQPIRCGGGYQLYVRVGIESLMKEASSVLGVPFQMLEMHYLSTCYLLTSSAGTCATRW